MDPARRLCYLNRVMSWNEEMNDFTTESAQTVIIGRFGNREEAVQGKDALETLFDDLKREVDELFTAQGGEAQASDISRIYAKRGLRNEICWEQELPMLINGEDVAWALPAGVFLEDAENLFWNIGARDVAIHQQSTEAEDWRAAPHPMFMSIPGEEDALYEDEYEDQPTLVTARKRTIH